MPHALSVRFLEQDAVACPLVRHHLRMRGAPEAPYVFDREAIRTYLERIAQAAPSMTAPHTVDIVEVYTGNKQVATIELDASKSVILDYGFVELLADNIALEYLTFHTEQAMHAWFAAGRPEDRVIDESYATIEIDGTRHTITGAMMLRDVACKFLNDIVPDAAKRGRLAAKLLWRTEDGGRPNAPYVARLGAPGQEADVMAAFVADTSTTAAYSQQLALVTAFVACHEIAHLVYSEDEQASLHGSRLMQGVFDVVEQLSRIQVEHEGRPYTLGDVTADARSRKNVMDVIVREALVDIRAVEMLIEHERRQTPALDRWSTWFANLFGLISMTNSLGIFRRHLDASIRDRSVAMPDIHSARSEAVTRNLIVLAYLLERNRDLAGERLAAELLPKIPRESLVLVRRMLYFQLDLVANVGEDNWEAFIDSALA